MYYRFAILDPRNNDQVKEANDKVFATGPVVGIEVTIPSLAERCAVNIDPQHSGENHELAAIEVALTCELPPDGAILATIRADLDSVGAMAVLDIRKEAACIIASETGKGGPYDGLDPNTWQPGEEILKRIRMVAEADKFARGKWPGKRSLPTREKPWDDRTASAESTRSLAAIAAAVSDFRFPLDGRVREVKNWLMYGIESEVYRGKVEAERLEMVQALENREIQVSNAGWCPVCDLDYGFGGNYDPNLCPQCFGVDTKELPVAVVISSHRAATSIGYMCALVVVALNPKFSFQGGEPHRKFTVCQFTADYVDMDAVRDDLISLEPGWGGSPTIIGSPQGMGSELTIDQVVSVVVKRLI